MHHDVDGVVWRAFWLADDVSVVTKESIDLGARGAVWDVLNSDHAGDAWVS